MSKTTRDHYFAGWLNPKTKEYGVSPIENKEGFHTVEEAQLELTKFEGKGLKLLVIKVEPDKPVN